jgi:hypothetical protein
VRAAPHAGDARSGAQLGDAVEQPALHVVGAVQGAPHGFAGQAAREVVHDHLRRERTRLREAAGAHRGDGGQQEAVDELARVTSVRRRIRRCCGPPDGRRATPAGASR